MNRPTLLLCLWAWLSASLAVAQSGQYCDTHQTDISYYSLSGDICEYAAVTPVSGKAINVCRKGDKIYFHNLFCAQDIIQQQYLSVEGTVADGIITLEMGQLLMTYEGYDLYLGLAESGYDSYGNFQAKIIEDAPYQLTIDSEGRIQSVDKEVFLVAYHSKDEVSYILVRNLDLSPYSPNIVQVPDGLQTSQYAYRYTKDYAEGVKVIQLGSDGNDCYIQGLCIDSAWVKGTWEGDSLIIPSNQYQGIVSATYVDFVAGVYAGENFVTGAKEYVPTDHFAFAVSDDRKTLTPAPGLTIMLLAGKTVYSIIEGPTLTYFEEKPATPATPELLYGQVDATWGGIDFNIYAEDVDGNFINPENITWSILLDDEVFTFEPGLYSIEAPMSEFPYDYIDLNGGTEIYSGGAYHHVSIYGELYTTIGVEVYYTVNGERRASARLTYPESGDDSAIGTVVLGSSEIISETYTDLMGRSVSRPHNGLYIRTLKFADGTTRSIKTFVK